MTQEQHKVRSEIERAKASMAAKLDELSHRYDEAQQKVETVREKVETVREQVSLTYQIEERPWTMMGVSVLSGFLLYRFVDSPRVQRTASRAVSAAKDYAQEGAVSALEAAEDAIRKSTSVAHSARTSSSFSAVGTALESVARQVVNRFVDGVIAGLTEQRQRAGQGNGNRPRSSAIAEAPFVSQPLTENESLRY